MSPRPSGDRHWAHLHPEKLPRGDRHHTRRNITDEKRAQVDLVFILEAQGLSQREIGAHVGLSQRVVSYILRGERWGELGAEREGSPLPAGWARLIASLRRAILPNPTNRQETET